MRRSLRSLLQWRVLLPFSAALVTIITAGLLLVAPSPAETMDVRLVSWGPQTPAIEHAIQRQERILENVVRPAMKAASRRAQ